MSLKVIVSGAGVAGLALSHWLGRIGATTILVERAPRFQALGHYISLKGNGVEMVRRMGILGSCQARAAPIERCTSTQPPDDFCAANVPRRLPRPLAAIFSSAGATCRPPCTSSYESTPISAS